jgi:UDP-N-acetylglucosamine--N-acetylmuramyl-(pentapeptide) pyrophosphoryl-undecaprenol N-acetylglucosamine transferase
VSAVGLPAVFVPLPHGNGEQALNALPIVEAGGGLLIPDAELTSERVVDEVLPLVSDRTRLAVMSNAARSGGHREAADVLAQMVLSVVNK